MNYFLLSLVSWLTLCGSDLHWAQKSCTRAEIESRVDRYLQKDSSIRKFFSLTDKSLVLYSAPEEQEGRVAEFSLDLARRSVPLSNNRFAGTLLGVKIALDPGHLGGPYARLEERYIDIPPSLQRDERIQFDEGTLSFLTALYLKTLLEKEGAIVMITRDEIGKSVHEQSFFDWLSHSPEYWSDRVVLSELFRKEYNPLDLRARARKINAFGPDLTIIIHYNSHHSKGESSSNHCVSSRNYNLAFVPGSFCRGELAEPDSRCEFLRLLVTDDLDESRQLSRFVLDALQAKLGVPVVGKADEVSYLETVCLRLEEGIYARNLALTRLVHGPLCYGETLIQNNVDECVNLSRRDFVIGGLWCSSRVKEVAEGYFEGIKRYVLKKP